VSGEDGLRPQRAPVRFVEFEPTGPCSGLLASLNDDESMQNPAGTVRRPLTELTTPLPRAPNLPQPHQHPPTMLHAPFAPWQGLRRRRQRRTCSLPSLEAGSSPANTWTRCWASAAARTLRAQRIGGSHGTVLHGPGPGCGQSGGYTHWQAYSPPWNRSVAFLCSSRHQ
jgi:hypothetical protein